MIEITGKYNTAVCFTDKIDNDAYSQILSVCNEQAFMQSKIRIMPDVHFGKGCTIGTTMTLVDKVVPNMVGVDIGCGMLTLELGKIDIDYEKFDEITHTIPSGRSVWEHKKESFDLKELTCFKKLDDIERLERSLGTLGGGNHFIEIDEDDEGNKYLVIHTGSRNLGTQVAKYHQFTAIGLNRSRRELKGSNKYCHALPEDLCYLEGRFMDDYLIDLDICQNFAHRNRELIAEILIEKNELSVKNSFHTIHNYIDLDGMILRKGSVSAAEGEKILIPVNMRDGSLICVGKGNEDWNYSAPHGAGRLYSRTDTFGLFSLDEYEKEMQGVYSTCVSFDTLDESPMAYKNMDDIVNNIGPTADIIKIIRPVYNFKSP